MSTRMRDHTWELLGHSKPDVIRGTCSVCGKRWQIRPWENPTLPTHLGTSGRPMMEMEPDYCAGSGTPGTNIETTWE